MSLNLFSSPSIFGSALLEQTKEGIQTVANWGIDLLDYRERVMGVGIDKVQGVFDWLGLESTEVVFETIQRLDSHQTHFFQGVIRNVFQLAQETGEIHTFLLEPLLEVLTGVIRCLVVVIQALF